MAQATDDSGTQPVLLKAFRPILGAGANLAVTNASQAVTLTQTIPPAGCQVRIATVGTSDVHIKIGPSAAATTSDLRLLAGTVEVFQIFANDTITAILDTGTSGSTINVTLGYGA